MGRHIFRFGVLICLLIAAYYYVSVVKPVQPMLVDNHDAWEASDVRAIDYVDAIEPFLDLIAVYTREHRNLFQLRLDYLDISLNGMQNILVAIDNRPGGNSLVSLPGGPRLLTGIAWDLLLLVDNNRDFLALDENYNVFDGVSVLLERDLVMDTVIMSISGEGVTDGGNNAVNIQVFSLSPDMESVADSTIVFSSDRVADERAKVALLFWNTFQASTPAEALRSWDGAHTGPSSSRHGLRHLVEAASETRVPVMLIDLATPLNLSALDYLGVADLVVGLARDRVLFVDCICFSGVSMDCFGDTGYAQFNNFSSTELTPGTMPEMDLSLRQSIVMSSHSPESIVVIGGDFATSDWGIPGVAQYGLEYIANHPWILVSEEEVGAIAGTITPAHYSFCQTEALMEDLYYQLVASPPNPLTETAWQMYQLLMSGGFREEGSAQITTRYIYHMLAAAQWAETPHEKTDCNVDLDRDGKTECILANQQIFTTIDPQSGTMVFAFFKDDTGTHQIIGPTHQFSTSNYFSQIPGALSSKEEDGAYLADVLSPGVVGLALEDMATRKVFALSLNGINFTADGMLSTTHIPLTVDPWQRFEPNWGGSYYTNLLSPQSHIWGLRPGIAIEIDTPNSNSFQFFNASIEAVRQPEDPNYDYTAGHYLPFPMAMIAVQPSNGSISVAIKIIP